MYNERKQYQEKPPSLVNQNSNLKDYIIAMNYYLQGRCKDFCSLLRDLPERALVKEIGDLVTIFELLKEDIDFYKGTISNIQDDRKGMEETMARAKQREEVCKVECKRKIEIQVEQIESERKAMADQMSSQEKSFTDEINRLKDLLEKEQKAFKLKAHECTRIIDLNAAFKKQIQKQNQDFQSEMMQLHNVLQVQKEKYNKDTRALREQSQSSIKEINKEHEQSLKEMQEENDKIMKHYKLTCFKLQTEMIELQEEIRKQVEIQMRTKAMLEMSQIDLRDNNIEIKRLNETVKNQAQTLENNSILIEQQTSLIQNLQLRVQTLEKQLLEKIEFLEIREQKWSSSVNDLMVEVELVCNSMEIPKMQSELQFILVWKNGMIAIQTSCTLSQEWLRKKLKIKRKRLKKKINY